MERYLLHQSTIINFYDLVDGIPKCSKPRWLSAAPGHCSGHWLGIPMSSPIFRGALQNAGWGSDSSLGQGRVSSPPHFGGRDGLRGH